MWRVGTCDTHNEKEARRTWRKEHSFDGLKIHELRHTQATQLLARGREHGFRVLQFNAVVATNAGARHLYEKLGFTQLGTIPGGFRMPDGTYADICPYYHEL